MERYTFTYEVRETLNNKLNCRTLFQEHTTQFTESDSYVVGLSRWREVGIKGVIEDGSPKYLAHIEGNNLLYLLGG